MMVNPDEDCFTKSLHNRKVLRKIQKNNPLKTKRILKPKFKLSGVQFLHLACQVERFAPLASRQLCHWFSHSIKLRGLLENVYAGLWNTSWSL